MVEKNNNEKLKKLGSLLLAIKKDVVTPRDIEGFVVAFLDEVKKAKDSLEILTEEKLAYLDSVLNQFEEKRADLLKGIDSSIEEREKYLTDEFGNSIDTLTSSVSSEITPLRDVLSESIKEAQAIIKQLKNVKIKDGEPGKDADETLIVDRVLEKIVLPEYKETVLDSGEQIVDKINALDLSEENKIDASHIKNLPEPKMIGGGSTARNLYQLGDVNISEPTEGQSLVYNSTTQLWENGAAPSFTTEEAQDAVGAMADSESLVYADATPLLSVKVQQSITKDASGLKLSGDSSSPGNNKVYGTDGSGVKGWKDDPSGDSGFTKDTIGVTVDGGGSVITTGSKGYKVIQEACTITGWTILGKESGSVVVDIKKSTYAGFPTTSSIAGTEKPTLSSAQKNQDLTLSTWTTSLAEGDILEFIVDSATTCTRFNLFINITI